VRGCLFVLLFAAIVIGSIAWFASAPIASTVVGAILDGSGFRAASSTISVTADPPPRLLLGQADRVSITATDVQWQSLRAARLSLIFDGVDLFARTATTIHGSLDAADVAADDETTSGGPAPTATIAVDGPAGAADAAITVDAATIRRLILAAVEREFSVKATGVELLAPNRLRLAAPGATIEATLVIDGSGALAVSTPLGSVEMFRVDPAIPLRLRSVTILDGALRLDGILDVNALLRG
jgi:hypothetical protein